MEETCAGLATAPAESDARAAVCARLQPMPPQPTVPSRSASLVVSSRSRAQVEQTTRSSTPQRSDNLAPNASHPTRSSPSLLKRLGRSLSTSGTQLVRRVSGSGNAKRRARSSSPQAQPPLVQVTAPQQLSDEQDPVEPAPTAADVGGAPLRRGLRVLGRSKSDGRRRQRFVSEEDKMNELVRRVDTGHRRNETGSDARSGSGLGSYFWSDALGVCWDGREQVHPDLLGGQPTYSSNADFVPAPRVVYASTLSTFPPRPPLRRLSSATESPVTPALSEAQVIAAAYREAHGLPSPSLEPEHFDPDFDLAPTPVSNALPTVSADVSSCAGSIAGSDSSSSRAPSELNWVARHSGHGSVESSTSVESMRDASPKQARRALPPAPSPLGTSSLVPRFMLVDTGPVDPPVVVAVGKARWATFEAGDGDGDGDFGSVTSGQEDWRDCE